MVRLVLRVVLFAAAIEHDLGLDRPIAVQSVTWLGKALTGDLGRSIIHRGKVMDDA